MTYCGGSPTSQKRDVGPPFVALLYRLWLFGSRDLVEAERGVALFADAIAVERAVFFVGWKLAAVFRDHDGVGGEDRFVVVGEEVQGGSVLIAIAVRRIEEDDVGLAIVIDHGVEQLADTAVFDGEAAVDFQRGDVGADGGGRFRFALGEPDEIRAAADGFKADGAGAGVEVSELRADDARGEDVEERFAQTVAARTSFEALGGLDVAGAIGSGDDAHGPSGYRDEVLRCAL